MVSEEPEPKFCDLTFKSAVLDSLAANIAVLDSSGEIVAVNSGWQDFAAVNHMRNSEIGVGTN